MVYANDQWIQMPVRDLYDNTIMLAAINTAKSEYERGLLEIKDFTKEYGDFITPSLKDLRWYNEEFDVNGFINDLYNSGIDPVRSVEGRNLVRNYIRSRDYKRLNNVKQTALMATEFNKNRAALEKDNKFNEEFERSRHGGMLPEDWDSSNGAWTSPSPATFQGIQEWTKHLFDDMELSLDEEETKKHPGFIAYTKSKDTMSKILDTHMDELSQSDLGRYYLDKIKQNIPDEPGADKETLARQMLKEDIISSNYDQNQIKLEADPYKYAYAKGGGGGGRRSSGAGQLSYNWNTGLFLRGICTPFGYDPETQGDTALNSMAENQVAFGAQIKNAFGGRNARIDELNYEYTNKYVTYESPDMFSYATDGYVSANGGVEINNTNRHRLFNTNYIVTNTYGCSYAKLNNGKYDNVAEVVPYEDVYTAMCRDGAIRQYWKVGLLDKDGNNIGIAWYLIPTDTDPQSDVPKLSEWKYNPKTGKAVGPRDKKGNKRGTPYGSVSKRNRGLYEKTSRETNQAMGVGSVNLNRNSSIGLESVSIPPFNSKGVTNE